MDLEPVCKCSGGASCTAAAVCAAAALAETAAASSSRLSDVSDEALNKLKKESDEQAQQISALEDQVEQLQAIAEKLSEKADEQAKQIATMLESIENQADQRLGEESRGARRTYQAVVGLVQRGLRGVAVIRLWGAQRAETKRLRVDDA